jgi:Cdc6-like AAA superfamily ATPase
MLKDAEQHQAALYGLERATKILWCYTIAEREMLPDTNTKSTYRAAVFDLYVTLLHYQALAAQYFGKSTIKRIWKNVTTTTSWSNIAAKINDLDNDCRRCISFLGFKEQQRGTVQLKKLLEDHSKSLKLILEQTENETFEKARVLEWISTIAYGADHDNVRESLGESYLNRGLWLFNNSDGFKCWQRSSSGVFLLKGTAGTGKSSLTSMVIQHFIDTPAAYLAYFYCSRKEKTIRRSDTTMIIRSLIKCLSVNGHPAFKAFVENHRSSESQRAGGCELQLKKCISLLRDSFSANPAKSIVLVVDALDECVDPNGLLRALKEIWMSGQRNLRLFLSSRMGVEVKAIFPEVIETDIGLSNSDDIRYYLRTEIERRRADQNDRVMTLEQAKELEEVLIGYAGGM